jgi:CDP-diacylglycerol--glycerol-3-phosphate 3-phosphatidyltransferase
MNLPNRLTIIRLILVPVFVLALSIESIATYIVGYVVFMIASITDYWDGRIARERNLITNFGKLMDPVADKVLLASAFVMLMKIPSLSVPAWTIVAILAREFLVTGARSMAAAGPKGEVIAANVWGKYKTVIQMTYIYTFLFFAIVSLALTRWAPDYLEPFATILGWASWGGIVFVAAFTLYTGIQFAQANWQLFRMESGS